MRLLLLATIASFAAAACPFSGQSSGPCPGRTPDRDQGDVSTMSLKRRHLAAPDPGQKTVQGCTCTTSCGATLDDQFDCAWCSTADNCGHFGITGHYDYCVFPQDDAFEKQTFEQKNAYFWSKISADKTRLAKYPNVANIVGESIQVSFDEGRDELPSGRQKYIHSVGAICPFVLDVAADSPYTGLFAPGTQKGFVRMGSAVDPVANKGITPGLGIKFARTGVHSGNYVALHSLDLGQSWDFFAYNVSNHISPPTGFTELLAKKFNQASQCAAQVGLSDMARYSQDGTKHDPPTTPFKLFLVPGVSTPATPKTLDQINAEVEAFPVGSTLYTVYACAHALGDEMTPTDGGLGEACGSPTKLGAMVTTAKCTSSKWGDEKFYIRHQRIEEDWAAHPEFLTQYNAAKACGWSGELTPQGAPKKCADAHA